MSKEAVRFVLDKYSVSDEVFRIYYDFEQYSGGHVMSVAGANPVYSGQLNGNINGLTGTSGSGNFNQGYVKVTNADSGLNSGYRGGATFLFSTKKSNTAPGVVFSNFGKDGDSVNYYEPTSGWEVGINQANKLYFRNYNLLVPSIYTLNTMPAAENIYGVSMEGPDVGLWHYDAVSSTFNTTRFILDENFIRPSYDWYIGTGEYQYSGYMDEFLYLSDSFGLGMLEELSAALFQEVSSSPAVSGVISGLTTGFSGVPTGATGYLYYTGILSGTESFVSSGTTFTGEGITGPVGVGDIYYELATSTTGFLGNNYPFHLDSYSGFIATTTGTRITGFTTGTSGFTVTGSRNVYQSSGVGGIVATGTGYYPLRGLTYYTATGASSGLVSTEIHKYLPDSLCYLGQRSSSVNVLNGETGDLVEIITGAVPDVSNVFARYSYHSEFGQNTYWLNSGSGSALFLNGVQQFKGDPLVTEDRFYQKSIGIQSGDFFPTGFFLFQNTFRSVSPSFNNDQVMADLNQTGSFGRLAITGSGQYASSPFSGISPDNTQVFFNGQKIYSGFDYESSAGLFSPMGTIVSEGMTGYFTTLPLVSGQESLTGIGLYDKEFASPYVLDSMNYYINGIRQDPSQFIQHSTGVDLIGTGLNIVDSLTGVFYNINREENVIYSSSDYWE